MTINPTVVFAAPDQVVLEDRPMPETGPTDLLVETHCSLISTGTELTLLGGDCPPGSVWADCARFPITPGYDNVGVVKDAGRDLDKSWIGRRVASAGIHARYVKVTTAALPIPDPVTDEHATFLVIAQIVMNGLRRGGIQWGECVVVYGAGLLGQMAARLCRLAGARPVIVVDAAVERLACLPSDDPALLPVDASREDPVECVARATRKGMADCVIELTGNADVIPREVGLLHNQGRLVILSSPQRAAPFHFHDLCNAPSITIIGAHNNSHPKTETPLTPWTKRRHGELFFALVADRELMLDPLISHRAPFTRAPELYAMLRRDRRSAMGVVLDWRTGP